MQTVLYSAQFSRWFSLLLTYLSQSLHHAVISLGGTDRVLSEHYIFISMCCHQRFSPSNSQLPSGLHIPRHREARGLSEGYGEG